MQERVRLHIDQTALGRKPANEDWGAVCSRVCDNDALSEVTVAELAAKLGAGHTVCPAVMSGTKAADWREQQVFMVDVDNADDLQPALTLKAALAICEKNSVPPTLYYQTFSYAKEKPKYRLVFVADKPVTDPDIRRQTVDALTALFPQSDKAYTNANRIFLGTNKRVNLLDETAHISVERLLREYSPPPPARHHLAQNTHNYAQDSEIDTLKQNFDFLGFLAERNGVYTESGNIVSFKNCEICGHHGNLRYYKDSNTFYCFSSSGETGGSIIDYLMKTEDMTLKDAIHKLKYELSDTEWRTPMPLQDVRLPSFPVDALPEPLTDWVKAVAESTATVVDMAAVCVLPVIALAVQGKFEIEGKADYTEPLNLYVLIIARSGERKSAIVKKMTHAIMEYERAENSTRRAQIAERETKLNSLKKKRNESDKKGKIQEAQQYDAQYKTIEAHKVKLLRLIADDATPEALTSLLADNGGIMSVISTEGGFFDTLAGRYSNTVSIDTVLKAHSGDPIYVDRKGSPPEEVANPALTMLLAAQENVLEGLLNNEVFKGRGLTARILYSKPNSLVGKREYDTPKIPIGIKAEYDNLMIALLRIPRPQNGFPKGLHLDKRASARLTKYFNWIERQLGGELRNMDGWGEKLVGATLRIAGILHCVQNSKSPSDASVTVDTLNRAIKIGKYFLEHAKFAHSMMGADKTLQGAKRVLRRLEQQTEREMTKYDIFHMCRGRGVTTVDDILPSLELLIEYGYLKVRTNDEPTGGRPRGYTYILNPIHFDS
jgi:hypothetical protein